MAERLKIPVDLQTRGVFEPSTFNAEKGTVEVVFTTGARGLRGGLFSPPFYEELEVSERACDLSRLNNGAPYMDDHPYKRGEGGSRTVLGVVERAWIQGKEGRAVLRFSDRADVQPIRRDVQNGILRHVSCGYQVGKYERVGDIEGVPVMRAVRWTPVEISQTPLGFDDSAVVRGRAEPQFYEVEVSTEERHAMAETTTVAETTETAKPIETRANAVEEATRAAANARRLETETRALAQSRATEEAIKAERHREVTIRSIVREHNLGDELADKLVKSGAKLDEVREGVLNTLAARSDGSATRPTSFFSAGEDVREKFVRGGCASIFQRSGQAHTIAAAMKNPLFADQFRGVSLDAGEYGGMRLRDLARMALELRGQPVRGLSDEQIVERALQYRDAGQQGTGDFPILLETAVNKTFLGAYEQTPVTWRGWCGVKSLQDFRASTFYRPGTFSTLDAVTEHGEVKHKSISDGEKMSMTPTTKGNIVSLSRRAIVNDDMGVFNDLAGGLGQAAANTIEAAAYLLLTTASGVGANYPGDTHPLFYTTRNNIGPTGAMTIATIDGARAIMAKQKDPSSNVYLNLRPSIWLGPVELEGQARVFNENATDPTANLNGVTNRVKGIFNGGIIGSAYLSAQSTVRHYFFANPGQFPVVAVGFINGREAPQVMSYQNHEYDGVRFRILHDNTVAIIDYRGAVTCAGQ